MELMKKEKRAVHCDAIPIRLVIVFVGTALLAAVAIDGYLAFQGKPATQTSIIIQCITGLLALLGSTRSQTPPTADNPLPVEVANTAENPARTHEVSGEIQEGEPADENQGAGRVAG